MSNGTSTLYNYNILAQNYNSFINIFYDFFADPIPENLTFQYTDPNNGPEIANIPNLLQIQNNILSNLSENIIENSIYTLQTLVANTNTTLFYEINQLNYSIINTSTELLDNINSNTILINNINSNLENNYYTIDQTNTTFFPISGGIISGNVTVQGDFQVNGTSYILDSTTMDVGDSFIVLNSSAIEPGLNAGIEVNRGNSTSVYLIWNEAVKTWQVSDINGNYWDIVTEFSNTSLNQLILGSEPTIPMQAATKEYVDNSYNELNSDITTNTLLIYNTSNVLTSEINNTNTTLLNINDNLTNLIYNTSNVLNSEINNTNTSLTNLIYNTSSIFKTEINNVNTSLLNVNTSLTNLIYNTSAALQIEIDNVVLSNSNTSLTNLIYNTSNTLQSGINSLNMNLINSSSVLQNEIVVNNNLINSLNTNLLNNYYSIYQTNSTFLSLSGGAISGDITIQGNFQVNGTSYILDSTTMNVGDSFIVLNSSAIEPGLNAGIEVNRGNGTSVYLIWNEVLETWQLSDVNGNYWDIVTEFSNTSLVQLVLGSDPTMPMQTATKEYVDNVLQSEINNITLSTSNSSLLDLIYNTSSILQSEINNITLSTSNSSLLDLIYNTSNVLQSEINYINNNLSSNYYTTTQVNSEFLSLNGGTINGNLTVEGNLTVTTINGAAVPTNSTASTNSTAVLPNNISFTTLNVNQLSNLHGQITLNNTKITGPIQENNKYGMLWFTNNGANTIQSTNTQTLTVGSPIAVGSSPYGICISPDGSTVWSTNSGVNTIQSTNTQTLTVDAVITVGSNPYGICISPDGSTAWVTNGMSNTIQPINTQTLTAGTAITVGSNPYGICISPNGSAIWFTNSNDNTIQPINTQTLTAGTAITVGSNPYGICISPDGSTVWVTNFNSNTIQSINTQTLTVDVVITVGSGPWGICISPDGSTAWVVNSNDGTIQPINTQTLTAGTAITVGSYPYGICISPDGSTIWVANYSSNTIQPVNTQTLTAGTAITVGSYPYQICYSPNGNLSNFNIQSNNGNFNDSLSCKTLFLNSTTTVNATEGNTTLQFAPVGFIEIMINGTLQKIPYFNI